MARIFENIMSQSGLDMVCEQTAENLEPIEPSDFGLSGAELDDLMDNHFRHVVDVLSDGIFYMSCNRYVCFYNPSFYKRFGIQSGRTTLEAWIEHIHPLDRRAFEQRVDEHIEQDGVGVSTQYRARCTNGQYIWLEAYAVTKTVNGLKFMIGCHKDISDRKLLESYVHQSSFIDGSSGLSNEQKLAVDLDNLKQGNQDVHHLIYIQPGVTRSYQTLYGGQIMRNLLSHLTKTLNEFPERFVDMYRIQSHDFAIVLNGHFNHTELTQLAERINQAYLEATNAINSLFANEISIGIYPDISPLVDTDEIVKVAAQTCQFAASQTDNHIRIYSGETKSRVDRHFYIEQELANAIRSRTLSVKFQPIVCSKSHKVTSFETLVRWRSKQLGEIYPDEFIAVAEQKGLIGQLGDFVFDKACSFIKAYNLTHSESVSVNVNVSVAQLFNPQFPDKIKRMTEEQGVNAKSIMLELTETILLDGNKQALAQLKRLSDLGFKLSLDDFGAGYTSLSSFFDLPLQQIKIDKSFAWRSLENPATLECLSFITKLCNSYNIGIVVEGIEDAQMQHFFTNLGASNLQGFWFSKPLSLANAIHYSKV